jgi:hypothetical protein
MFNPGSAFLILSKIHDEIVTQGAPPGVSVENV